MRARALVGAGSVAIYHEGGRGMRPCGVLLLDPEGKVIRAIAPHNRFCTFS